MREIIFRGKEIYTNEWVEGSLILYKKPVTARTHEDSFENHYYIKPFEYGEELEVDPETIGQFTGLTDKNGVKIFEGDIIRNKWGVGIVKYVPSEFAIEYPYARYPLQRGLLMGDYPCEILGNIHDNLGLLEVT